MSIQRTLITALTLQILVMKIDSTTSINITQLTNHTALYFENLGKARVAVDRWTLLVSTDLDQYEAKLNTIIKTTSTADTWCKINATMKKEPICERLLNSLMIRRDLLIEKFETLNHLTGHSSPVGKRSRRELNLQRYSDSTKNRVAKGLIDGVSTVIKFLIGTPDAQDAKRFDESITKALNDEKNIQLLMKEQIQIIQSTITNFNETTSSLKHNEEIINSNIQYVNELIHKLHSKETAEFIKMRVTVINNVLIEMITSLEESFDSTISAILLAHRNILHPTVITPKNLFEELKHARLPSDLEFPIPTSYLETHWYNSLIKIDSYLIRKRLIFALKIPLVQVQKYELFRILPLPTPSDQSPRVLRFIEPNFPYLLLNQVRTQYAKVQDLNQCEEILPFDFICVNPIIHRSFTNPPCEVSIITTQPKVIPETCKISTLVAETEIWHQLRNNKWLYILSQPVSLSLICKETQPMTDFILNGRGVIQLQPDCQGYTSNTIIYAESETTFEYENIAPTIPFKELNFSNPVSTLLQNTTFEPLRLTNLHTQELKFLSHKLNQFDEILQENILKPQPTPSHDWWNTFCYITGLVILIYLLRIIINFIQYRRQKLRNQSIHLPYRENLPLPNSCGQCFQNCLIIRALTNCTKRQDYDDPEEPIEISELSDVPNNSRYSLRPRAKPSKVASE